MTALSLELGAGMLAGFVAAIVHLIRQGRKP